MKNTLFLLSLIFIVACGKGGDGHSTAVEPITSVNKLWTVTSYNDRSIYKFTSIDFTNENAVIVSDLQIRGIDGVSSCTFDTVLSNSHQYGGTFTVESVTAGNPDICGEISIIGFGAHRWEYNGVEVLSTMGSVLH